MRLLVILPDAVDRGILIGIRAAAMQKEIGDLIRKGEREEAMVQAVLRGVVEEELHLGIPPDFPIDCILSRERACWEHRK